MGTEFQQARRSALICAASAVLTGCGGGGAGDGAAPTASGQVINSTIKSVSNGNTYPIQVFLPESYATSTTVLPVIYATEGVAPYGGANRSRFDTFKEVMQRRGYPGCIGWRWGNRLERHRLPHARRNEVPRLSGERAGANR